MAVSKARKALKLTGRVLFWIVLGLEVLTMGEAGLGKFEHLDGWLYWFAQFGYPPQMSLVVGGVEVVGAGLLLVPKLAAYVAPVLMVIMFGALEAVLTTETDLGWFDPVLHLVLLTIILAVRWPDRWHPRRAHIDAATAP